MLDYSFYKQSDVDPFYSIRHALLNRTDLRPTAYRIFTV